MKHVKYANEPVIILNCANNLSGSIVRDYWVSNMIGLAVYRGNYAIIEYLLENLEKPDLEYPAKLI